jgi:hypothetical protein
MHLGSREILRFSKLLKLIAINLFLANEATKKELGKENFVDKQINNSFRSSISSIFNVSYNNNELHKNINNY